MPLVEPGDGNRPSNPNTPGDTSPENPDQKYTGTVERKILPSNLDGKAYSSKSQNNTWIVIHNVGPGSADACYNTFVGNERNVSTHYTCDDKKIIQMLENNWKGNHVNGGSHCSSWPDAFTSGATNSNSIGIEVGNSGGGVSLDDNKAIEMGIELCRYLMKEMNIDIDHVVRHGDCQNKPCPQKIMELGKWNYFKEECVKRNEENKPITFDSSQLSGGDSNNNGGEGGSNGYNGNANFVDIIPNVDHRYNIANMDKVTGACLVFLPPYNVCNLDQQEEHFKKWNNWDRQYHYLIDPKYDVDANPDDDIPDLSNAKGIEEMGGGSEDNSNPDNGNEDSNGGGDYADPGDLPEDNRQPRAPETPEEPNNGSAPKFTDVDFNDASFVGDSLTVGLGQAVSGLNIFATVGQTVGKGRVEHAQKVINKKSKIVVISYGTNDAGYKDTSGFITNYKNFINDIKTGIPGVTVFVNKIFPGDASKANENGKICIENIPAHNNAIDTICQETGAVMLNCTTIPDLTSYYSSDGIHFKSDFYKLWYNEMKKQIMQNATGGTGDGSVNSNVPAVEDNSIVIKGGFLIDRPRLLQCYGLEDNDKATYISRSLYNSKPTAHCLMIACFIPTHVDLADLKINYQKVEKNIVNAVSKILWANGLEAKDLWREFDMNRAPSPANYLDRDTWKDLLFEIDKQIVWRNKKFGKVVTKYEKYVATIPDQTVPNTSGGGGGGTPNNGGTSPDIGGIADAAEAVWKFFTGKGFTPECTAGILGNMEQESGVNPNAIQGGGKGPAAGICQWENYNTKSARWKGLNDYAQSKGKEWTDLQCQLEWLDMELQGKDSTTLSLLKKKVGGYDQFKALTDVDKACLVFEEAFERAGKPNMERRYSAAKKYYDKFKGSGGSTSSVSMKSRAIQPQARAAQFSWPTPGITEITSKFGPRKPPCEGASSNHGGIDIAAPMNTDVHATAGGTVTLATYHKNAGNYLVIDHGNGWGSRYLHLNKFLVSKGDTVQANQVIAKSGDTGVGTGAHLHFEIQKDFPAGGTGGTKVDPELYVNPGEVVGNPNPGGGGGTSVSLDKVLLIGDSLTVGMKPVIEKKYSGAQAMGKGGKWATQWLEDLNSLPSADSVSCVIQWLGINGVHNNKKNIEDSQKLLNKLKEKYSGKPIFNMKIFPTGKNYSYGDYTGEWWKGLSEEFNNAMSSWCSSNGVTQIDATEGFIQSDGYLDESKTVDKLHFTTAGYEQILANIEKAIQAFSGSSGGSGDGGGGTTGPLVNSLWGEIKNPGPAANLPYNGNSMGGLEHDDWGGKMSYYVDKPEDENAEKPEIKNIITDYDYQTFCETYFIDEAFNADGTTSDTVNFNKFWQLIDLLTGETEPYDKGLVNAADAAITPNDRLNALTTTFTTDNENVFHFNVIESGPGSKDHCVKAADELNFIITPTDLRVEPIYPDLIIPPQYTTSNYDQVSENTIPLCMIEQAEDSEGFTKQLQFDYDLLKDKKKETNKALGPINFLDPYPTDDKIEELERHFPKVFIDEIESQIYSCNHPGCPIGQPMAKNFAMLSDAIMNQSKRTEKRLVRLENILSTIMRNQARLSSRININCVYYGGQSTYAGKYKCIRCMHDNRIDDGAIVTLDQCLNCTRYEPILGQVYQILDESGFNGSIILDDMQMSYSDLSIYKRLNTQIDRSPQYDYVKANEDPVIIERKDLIDLWKEANKKAYLDSLPKTNKDNINTENRGEDTGVNPAVQNTNKELEEAQESNYVFRMNWNETFLNSQQPDTKQYPTEGIIMRFKKQTGDLSYTDEIKELDPEKDKEVIEDLQKQIKLVNGQWTDTREISDTVQTNKYSSEKFYFEGFAEIKQSNGIGGGVGPGTGIGSAECRKKICEMAETIVQECKDGKAWYSQNNRTVDYNNPGYSNGKKAYDCSGFVSCCYLHAGLKSMYAKSCGGGTLMDEIVNNGGEMWLMNEEGFSKAKPGDVIVVATSKVSESQMGSKIDIEHAIIYMGDKTIAHARNSKKGIVKEAIEDWRIRDGDHVFVRPKDLIDADAAAEQSGGGSSGGGVTESEGTVDDKKYVARVLGAVCTTYTGDGGSASGLGLEYNKTCASHNMPYGTKIYIPQLADKLGGDGVLTVTDTGGCFFDFDLYTQSNIGKVNADVYILEWGKGKVAASYTWAINYYLDNGRWNGLKAAWNTYKDMGGKLMNFTKFSQEDANIKNHPNYNDK